MSAVAHTYRLSILNELVQNGELKCCDVEGITGLSQPTCSHHIKLLAESELIDCRKQGRSNYISECILKSLENRSMPCGVFIYSKNTA